MHGRDAYMAVMHMCARAAPATLEASPFASRACRGLAPWCQYGTCAVLHKSTWQQQRLIPLQQLWRSDRQHLKGGRM